MITKAIIISLLLVIVCVISGHGISLQTGRKRHFMLPPGIPSGKRSLMDTGSPRGGEGLGKRRFRVPPSIPPGKRSSVLWSPDGEHIPVQRRRPPAGKRSQVVRLPDGKRSLLEGPPFGKR